MPPSPLRAPMAKEYGIAIPPRTFRRHRDKKVERIAKKRRAEAASHLTSSPYKAILLAKPASPPSKKNTKKTECDLTEKSTKIRTMKKIGHVSYVGNLHNSRSREKWIERISCKKKAH